jgi:hypothetical protein
MLKAVISQTASEGLGSCYERCQLFYLLPELLKGLNCKSVLEFPVPVSKGWDNLGFLKRGSKVVVGNESIDRLENLWPYEEKPIFAKLNQLDQQFDLVWNFAVIHQDPLILEKMAKLSNRYILVFTPNVLNWGAPIHWGLHLLTRTKCSHPERGNFKLMNLFGLKRFLKKRGLIVVKAGYFDMPFWPDFAFSTEEIKKNIPFLKLGNKKKTGTVNSLTSVIEKAMFLEKKLPKIFWPIMAHHQYVLAKK